jgi:hypothetical protein
MIEERKVLLKYQTSSHTNGDGISFENRRTGRKRKS